MKEQIIEQGAATQDAILLHKERVGGEEYRVQEAIELLAHADLSRDQVERLRAIVALRDAQLELPVQRFLDAESSLEVAREIVRSLVVDDPRQLVTIPAGVDAIDALRALNALFRHERPRFRRDLVDADTMEWLETTTHLLPRNIGERWLVSLQAVVPHTVGWALAEQERIVGNADLVLAHPLEQALVAGAYALKHGGADLFTSMRVRGRLPGFCMATNPFFGLMHHKCSPESSSEKLGASGSC